MAELTNTGIDFTDVNGNVTTSMNSRREIYPQNATTLFYRASAPTGWTQVTSQNDKALRVVNGTGAGGGGNNSFSTVFGPGKSFTFPWQDNNDGIGERSLANNNIPSHTHGDGGAFDLTASPQNPNGTYTTGDVARGSGWGIDIANQPGINAFFGLPGATGGVTGPDGNGHIHPFSASGTSPSIDLALDVQYIDCILCSFDG